MSVLAVNLAYIAFIALDLVAYRHADYDVRTSTRLHYLPGGGFVAWLRSH